jgi:hypothetical protein
MRARTLRTAWGSTLLLAVACATATQEDPSTPGGGEGGSGGSGGATPLGGSSTGGASTGGASTGGSGGTATGGADATGGSDSTGGTSGKGGSGGDAGMSGASGKGGSSPFGGASGMGGSGGKGGASGAGAGGKSGAGGMSGAGGAGGAGGSGGSVVVPPTGECAMNPTLALQYKVNQTGDSIAFDLKLTNSGAAPIAANTIEFQYYISQEESSWQDKTLDVYAIQSGNYMDLKTTGTITVDPLMPALGMQTHVIRIKQTSGGLLPPGATNYLQLTARLQPNPAAPNQMQTNDFSYDAAHMTLGAWDHIAVFVNGVLSFGCTPEA